MVLGAVVNICKGYYFEFPRDAVQKISKSAFYSFTITFILTTADRNNPFNIVRPLIAASAASFASLIHALITPIFNKVFGDNSLQFHREAIKQVVNITLSSVLIHSLTASKVNLLALPLIISVSMNLVKSFFNLFPSLFEKLLNDSELADETKDLYRSIGLFGEDGSNSVYINASFG